MSDALLATPLGGFGESYLSDFNQTLRQADGAKIASLRPDSGYWNGLIRLRVIGWGYQKQGSFFNPAGTTNRFHVQVFAPNNSNLGYYDTVHFNQAAAVGYDGPHPPYQAFAHQAFDARIIPDIIRGLPGASSWRIHCRANLHYPAGTVFRAALARRGNSVWTQFFPGKDEWLTDTDNDGQAEYTPLYAVTDAPTEVPAFTVNGLPAGFHEKVFIANGAYPYRYIHFYTRLWLDVLALNVPQLPIEETDYEVFEEGQWVRYNNSTGVRHPVMEVEFYFSRRAPMMVFYNVAYGSTALTNLLPTIPAAAGTLTYNAACQNARAAALATHGSTRVLVQLLGQPFVPLGERYIPELGGNLIFSIAERYWVDFTEAAVTSNLKVGYDWNFGDSHTQSGVVTTRHHYENCGLFVTSLAVTDSAGDLFTSGAEYRVLMIVPIANLDWRRVADGSGGFAYQGAATAFTPTSGYGQAAFTNGIGFYQVPGETNLGGPGETFYWEFGDGATSTAKFPIHTYTTLGVKTVRVTVTAANGWAVTHSRQLQVVS